MVLNFYISFSISYQQSNSTSFKSLQLANDQESYYYLPLTNGKVSSSVNFELQSSELLPSYIPAEEASPKRGFNRVRLGMVLC